jgi:hypothetical protein
MKSNSRSPIKDRPLRLPGQSVSEEQEELIEDAIAAPLLLALFMAILAGLEWWRQYTAMKPSPILFSIAALLAMRRFGSGVLGRGLRIFDKRSRVRGWLGSS